MSFVTGTATDHDDLYDKFITFITTDATLVGLSQNWTNLGVATGVTKGNHLRGPGLAGADEIFVNMRVEYNAGSDIHNIGFRGALGFDSGLSYSGQPFTSTEVGMAVWGQAMKYWFFANGRRFIIIAEVSGRYPSAYAGFFLPTGTPLEYPYPLVVAAGFSGVNTKYTTEIVHNRGFFDPAINAMQMNTPQNTWLNVYNKYISSNQEYNNYSSNVWPWNMGSTTIGTIDGLKVPFQSIIYSDTDGGNNLGYLDGVFFVSGNGGMSPEDTITAGADTYFVVNNVYRLGDDDFAAILQE